MLKKIIELDQLTLMKERNRKDEPVRLMLSSDSEESKKSEVKKNMSITMNKKNKEHENTAAVLSHRFMDFLQTDENSMARLPIQNAGTFLESKLLKDREKKIKSSFKVEFKSVGTAHVTVNQTKEAYEVTITFDDPQQIGQNPILFKNLIEKQLEEKLGVPLKIKVC